MKVCTFTLREDAFLVQNAFSTHVKMHFEGNNKGPRRIATADQSSLHPGCAIHIFKMTFTRLEPALRNISSVWKKRFLSNGRKNEGMRRIAPAAQA